MLPERGIKISHETARYEGNRCAPMFGAMILSFRARGDSNKSSIAEVEKVGFKPRSLHHTPGQIGASVWVRLLAGLAG